MLFLFDPLLLDHGVRSDNMESALLLAYCAGIYHFARVEALDAGRRRTAHALAFGVYLVPRVHDQVRRGGVPAAGVSRRGVRRRREVRRRNSAWGPPSGGSIVLARVDRPAALVVALCTPWFVYEWIRQGPLLWSVMLGQHVFTRFTPDPSIPPHLEPWHYCTASPCGS